MLKQLPQVAKFSIPEDTVSPNVSVKPQESVSGNAARIGAHPHGVKVRELLVGYVSHGTGPVHSQVDGGNDAIAVQNGRALLTALLQPLGPSPATHRLVAVLAIIPAAQCAVRV